MTKLLRCALFVFISVSTICAQQPEQHNPVIRGDRPDPSVIRVGNTYWATVTSGSWEPGFPLFHSRDLVHWEISGAVFQNPPVWMIGDFWAPEISTHRGRFFVYYTGRRTDGRLCVAVATASVVSGPYTDHGPLVCQPVGSIDGMAVTDDQTGARYLVWKEDGNDPRPPVPTVIWAQRLSDDGLKLLGEKVKLIQNEPKKDNQKKEWEHRIVEGPFILRRGNWFYLFYSGNSCCGSTCDYALGVARSKSLLGPYVRNPANPILEANKAWKCPGHGSIVTDSKGRDFLLYHAYRNSDRAVFIGREALLAEVSWRADGWPKIDQGPEPLAVSEPPADSLFDGFDGPDLKATWQWPSFQRPSTTIDHDGWLMLSPPGDHEDDALGAVLAQPVTASSFVATTLVDIALMKARSVAGLAAYHHREHAVGITVGRGTVSTYVREGNKDRSSTCENALNALQIYLRMTVTDGSQFRFEFSPDGKSWKKCGDKIEISDFGGARIALTAGGESRSAAKFDWLRITPN